MYACLGYYLKDGYCYFVYRAQHVVGNDHPTVWKLLTVLKKEDVAVRTLLIKQARGDPVRKKVTQRTRQLNTQLRNICQEFSRGERNMANLLNAVGHTIRRHVVRQQ